MCACQTAVDERRSRPGSRTPGGPATTRAGSTAARASARPAPARAGGRRAGPAGRARRRAPSCSARPGSARRHFRTMASSCGGRRPSSPLSGGGFAAYTLASVAAGVGPRRTGAAPVASSKRRTPSAKMSVRGSIVGAVELLGRHVAGRADGLPDAP